MARHLDMTWKEAAAGLGAWLIILGFWMVYPPLAFMACGLTLIGWALLVSYLDTREEAASGTGSANTTN